MGAEVIPMAVICGFAAAAFYLVYKIVAWPLKPGGKLAVNAVSGCLGLVLFNLAGGFIGLTLGVNITSLLVAAMLGLPGVATLLVLSAVL